MDPVSLERRRLLPSSSLVNNAINVLYLLAPFCGWLSDTKIGRGNAIYLGLILGWIGALIQAIGCCLQYNSFQCDTVSFIGRVHRFEHIPIPNPYEIVFKVLKFILKTSRTRRQHRSAFTYWGEEPSRMDLAKESFTTQFKNGSKENARVAILVVGNVVPFFVLVPLFELVILPLFPKLEYFIINPLKGLGLAYILIILSIVSLFLSDLIGRIVADNNSDVPCFFMWQSVHQTIDTSYWILLIPSVLFGTSFCLTGIYLYEFLCSQSPFGMHGMIIGFLWFLHGIFTDFAIGIFLIVYYHPMPSVSFMSCTSWLTMIFGIIAGIGLVVYVLIARWYVNRVRDTDLGLRTAVEEHWENRLTSVNNTETEDFLISTIRVNCIDVKAHLRSFEQLQKAQPLVKQHLDYAVQTTCFTKKTFCTSYYWNPPTLFG
uniref:Uncharacterized protein n=1 Tax=Amphimedon queenslandica TaxID=400682 RepID=A0A1X7TIK2_AMPQE